MGIWEQGSFQNDGAMDWVAQLETGGIRAIRKALRLHDGYVQIDDAQQAIAAAEVVASARGNGAEDLPQEVSEWISVNATDVSDADVTSAIDTVTRVRDSSELQEVWSEGPRYELWVRATAELLRRLEGSRSSIK